MTDLYKILNLHYGATEIEIKKQFRKLASIYHPDKNNGSNKSEELFKTILNAYEILSNKESRAAYDLKYRNHYNSARSNSNEQEANSKKPRPEETRATKTASKHSNERIFNNKIYYAVGLVVLFLSIIYFYSSGKSTTTGNPNADRELEQATETRPESGELDFNK